MLKNNIKLAFRLLIKHKGYALISITSIALGLTACLLIGLYIQHEWRFDRYHTNQDRLYRLANHVAAATYENGIAKVSGPWGPAAKQAFLEVEATCRFVFFGEALFKRSGQLHYESAGFYADSSVFDMFSWPLLAGDPQTALVEPNTMVLTQDLAEKYFGKENPMGQTITIDREKEYRITGVLADIPDNSHFTFNFLASLSSYQHPDRNDWLLWNQFYTYLLLQPGADPAVVAQKIDNLLGQHLDAADSEANTPFLQPIASIHLHSKLHREMEANSSVSYLYIFGVIALLVLIIACLNVINISTARAAQRFKEIGIRKVTGATQSTLTVQFLGETFLMAFLAVIPSVVLAELLLDPVNRYLGLTLSFHWMQNLPLLAGMAGLVLLVGLWAGAYPAFVLASFRPQRAIKGKALSSEGALLRKGLTVVQFSIAIFLLIGTLVVGGQLRYIQNKNLGFNKEQIVVIPLQPETIARIPTLKEEISRLPGVTKVSASANRPGGSDYGVPYVAVGLPENQQPAMRCLVIDTDFLDTYEMEMADGRGFQAGMTLDSAAYLINETAARQLGWENPLDHQLSMPAVGREAGPVIGVVKDFHFRSMHEPIAPLYFFLQPTWFSQLSIRIEAGKTREALADLEGKWSDFEPGYPFNYFFFDEVYDQLYRSEGRASVIMRSFTMLAVLVTCLGLFGLATYLIERRTKEIGIRKVLGASVPGIVGLLSRDVLQLIVISVLVAAPLAWLAANRWLESYAYRGGIHWWYFVLAGLLAILIAFLTISYQSIKAALSNPVEALKCE